LKIDEVRALPDAELLKRLGEARQELFNLQIRLSTRQLANHRELPRVKKRIARMQTIIKERELGIR
jgi:large subunit ribosomal protein L29